MLDDLKLIHERDVQDALGVAGKQFEQLNYEFEVQLPNGEYENVVFVGMGGSALGALVAQSWPGVPIPFEIVRNYSIPNYVSSKTLFVASSYSGNTEETISALKAAEEKQATIIVIASGGELQEIANYKNYPLLSLPTGYQPRYTVWLGLKAVITILDACGIIKDKVNELVAQEEFLKNAINQWIPEVPTKNNRAKQIAQETIGKSVVVYGGPLMYPAAYKWKISFNENAKHIAWVNQFPEFNHNEFLGCTKQPVQKPYTVIELRSNLENPRIQKRFEVTSKLLSGLRPDPIVVAPEGETLIQQLLWVIALGDFVSLYTAILGGINPTPVDLIEKFKQELI